MSMNVKKLIRMIDRGEEFYPSQALEIRRLIGTSLEMFFKKLKELPDAHNPDDSGGSNDDGVR